MATEEKRLAILVAEDEPLVRELSVGELEGDGYKVIEASSADKALEILESGAVVALVFTDVAMPGELSGLDLARIVHERWPDIQLIVTTGGGGVDESDVPDEGRFLPKPYSLRRMRALVHEMAGPATIRR